MANQISFVERTPEQKRAYVDEQIAKGNPKYMPRDKWLEKNAVPIAIRNLEQKVDALREENKKFREDVRKILSK
jgi:recombinational DNA repair ATPase RecF|tara:strand:- start:183 stop:404 length:222 start_codon:yes stop_codon:yes gene_type:complete